MNGFSAFGAAAILAATAASKREATADDAAAITVLAAAGVGDLVAAYRLAEGAAAVRAVLVEAAGKRGLSLTGETPMAERLAMARNRSKRHPIFGDPEAYTAEEADEAARLFARIHD